MTRRLLVVAVLSISVASTSHAQPPAAAKPVARAKTGLEAAPDQFFTANGVRVRFRDIGRGSPIVLIHGLGRSLEDWIGLGDSLALDHRVIAFDLRGFGQSSKLSDPARFGREMALDVPRLLDHLRLPRADVIGHSLGAVVTAAVATRTPTRVSKVALIAGPLFPDSASAAATMAPVVAGLEKGEGMRAFFRRFAPELPEPVARAASEEMMAANDKASLTAIVKSFGGLTIDKSAAQKARVPALIVVGTDDNLLEYSRWLASAWPNARLIEVAGAGHVDVLERPQLLAALRQQFRVAR